MVQMSKQSVVFLCVDNSTRSQMAAAFLRKYADDIFDVHNAGVEPNIVNPLTLQVMNEVGVNISTQKSKSLGIYFGKTLFHCIITLGDDVDRNCLTVWLGIHTRLHWSF